MKQIPAECAQVATLEVKQTGDLPTRWSIGAFVDVETTGLNATVDEIIEIAVVLFCFERDTGIIRGCLDEYVGTREPSVAIDPRASAVNGITMGVVRGTRINEPRVEAMLRRAEFIIAHNASFDRGFMTRVFRAATERPWLCSMRIIDWLGYGMHSRKLQHLLKAHGIRPPQTHRAAADVHFAIELLARSNPVGQLYMAELLRAAPRKRRAHA